MKASRWMLATGLAATLLLGGSASARADEPVSAREPRMLRETGENTTVVDAFDEGDVFDVNLLLSFRQSWKHATIRREGPSANGALSTNQDIASFSQARSVLDFGTSVGLFRDLALSLHLPLILSDSRELGDAGAAAHPERLADPAGGPLFAVPFKSPTRSGIDWFSIGLDYAVLNQQRDATLPTWVIGAETRIAVGERMHACNAAATIQCPDPANPGGPGRDPGISRGMNAILARTTFSRRYGYVEPYTGLAAKMEFAQSNSDFGKTSGLRGALLNRPPIVGTVTIGMEVFPWEKREQFQRVALDFKLRGRYHSPGRDYSELFDALGSSQAPSLRSANPGAYHAGQGDGTSVADPAAPNVYFAGITTQQAFGSFGGSAGVTWQAGEYIKFNAGAGLTYAQSHLVTAADACNPNFSGDAGAAGPCRVAGRTTGIPNPNHRPVIDLPGRRFSVDGTTIVDLWLRGVVMF